MNPELLALKEVLTRLNTLQIPYMLTGSVALQYYATPRMTRDVDIVVQITSKDAPALVKAFEKDFYIDRQSIEDSISHQSLFNLVHNESITKIDLVVKKNTPYRNLEFERRRKINIAGVDAWIVSPEDLIISKLDWAKESFSEIQLRDLETLFRAVKNLDQAYITKWVDSLGLQEILGKVKR